MDLTHCATQYQNIFSETHSSLEKGSGEAIDAVKNVSVFSCVIRLG